ncbi:MAG: phage baseplate assembly protein V [Candidatus Sulfotelmatobacter sp.]
MSTSLLDLLTPKGGANEPGRFFGVVVGVVTNNQDSGNMARVRVKFPWLSDDNESWWARIAVPMGGSGRGTYFLPEVDDEVLVAFEHGDVRSPYVIGALWNGKDAPPTTNSDGQNNIRVIHSRSGHLIRLDDTNGNEKIEIIDKTGGNKITIQSSDNSIDMECTGKMTLHASQGIDIKSDADINITANTSIDVTANTSIGITANTTMDIESQAPMTIKGAMVNIN